MPMDDLQTLRAEIDALDHQLLALLAARLEVARTIGVTKRAQGMAIHQPEREAAMREDRLRLGRDLGLPQQLVLEVLEAMLEASKRGQVKGAKARPHSSRG